VKNASIEGTNTTSVEGLKSVFKKALKNVLIEE
jgi:hypothetical protein